MRIQLKVWFFPDVTHQGAGNMGTTNRLVAAVLFAGLLAAAPGCKKPAGSSAASGGPGPESGGSPSGPGAPTKVPVSEIAESFLSDLKDGKADPARLTVDLKKRVSGKLVYPEEKERGYSDSDAAKWLALLGDGVTDSDVEEVVLSPSGDRASVRGVLRANRTSPKGGESPVKEAFAMRMVKEGSTWLVDRFHRGPAARTGLPKGDAAPELRWARESALDFLDSLLAGDRKAAAECMAPGLKAKVAKPVFSDDEKLGYSPTSLDKWLTSVAGGKKSYAITSQRMAAGDASAEFAGELSDGKKPTPFTIHVAPEKGAWVVSGFEVTPPK
jgi:hypothetical protein